MLITFRVENFLSINQEIELSMLAGQVRHPSDHVITHGVGRSRIDILKVAVVYGANASGKSNLIKAMDFGKQIILRGVKDIITHNKHFRLDADSMDKPSKFEYEFKIDDKIYAYGFTIHLATKTVKEEWLFEVGKTKDKPVFERTVLKSGKSEFKFSIKFDKKSEIRFSVYQQDILSNQLFLTELAEKDLTDLPSAEPFEDAFDWFNHHLDFGYQGLQINGLDLVGQQAEIQNQFETLLSLFNTGLSGVTTERIDWEETLPEYEQKIVAEIANKLTPNTFFIQYFDVGNHQKRFTIVKTPKGEVHVFRLLTKHKVKNSNQDIEFELGDESDGTKRLLDLLPFLQEISINPSTIVIDELDRSLHPELSRKFIELFFELSKNTESQMIVTTHESSLLDLNFLRRDEIWFTEKNADGETRVYSLEEYKPRFDNEIRKAYLMGRFGATPNSAPVRHIPLLTQNKPIHATH
jgi:uncharacterized protein